MDTLLTGQPTLKDIQSLLCGQASLHRLHEQVAGMLMGGFQAGSLRLTRAKYKPGRPLRAFYDVPLSGVNQGQDTVVPIAVVWPAGEDISAPGDDLKSAEAEIHQRQVNQAFARLFQADPQQGNTIQAWPLDPNFPQLVRIADPVHLQEMLPTPESGPRSWKITPVRYRPGERHVLRISQLDRNIEDDLFVKLYRSAGDAQRAYRIAIRAGEWLASQAGGLSQGNDFSRGESVKSGDDHRQGGSLRQGVGLSAARPRGWSAEDAVIYYPYVPGKPLSSLFSQRSQDLAALLKDAGRTIHALHTDPGDLAADLERTDLASEIKAVERATRHVRAFLPETGEQILGMLDSILDAGSRLPGEEPTFTHSDFKADHLLVQDGRMVLIDFDTCAMADPASDVGKFLADLEWWYLSQGLTGIEEIQDSFIQGYGARADRLRRARLYQALILLKITARRARLYDDRWPELVTGLVWRARAILDSVV